MNKGPNRLFGVVILSELNNYTITPLSRIGREYYSSRWKWESRFVTNQDFIFDGANLPFCFFRHQNSHANLGNSKILPLNLLDVS